jgi:alkylation response protein AidB-like acyl-CoA dehydrogenase
MRRTVFEPEHEQFREVVREFLAREVAPHAQPWEKAGIVDREVYRWWTTGLRKRVVDARVQMHGGYGYMMEFPVARAYLDARVQTIYGGTTEIMKEIVGRNLGV